MDEALVQFLNRLSPQQLRVLLYESAGGHQCNRSALIACCDQERCSACHQRHLRDAHSIALMHNYVKLSSTSRLTWDGKRVALPKKRTKQARRNVAATVASMSAEQIVAAIPGEKLAEVLAEMKKRMERHND